MLFYIFFYVPKNNAEKVKQAMFAAGAGKTCRGKYDSCSWETEGVGQFRPLTGSKPFIGEQNKINKVAEIKVEMFCEEEYLEATINALKDTHPYEEPVYGIISIHCSS